MLYRPAFRLQAGFCTRLLDIQQLALADPAMPFTAWYPAGHAASRTIARGSVRRRRGAVRVPGCGGSACAEQGCRIEAWRAWRRRCGATARREAQGRRGGRRIG